MNGWIFWFAMILYICMLIVLAILKNQGIWDAGIGIVLTLGAMVVCNLYFTKKDLFISGWTARHGEAPISRLLLLGLATLWLCLYPFLTFV